MDPGPDWATNIVADMTVIDNHNHTSGNGVPIPPSGLNINTDLPMNQNNLVTAKSVRFTPQGAPLSSGSDIGCVYESGVDLWYNDGSGNQVRLTQGGSPAGGAGSITGLPSGTASASYAGGTFTWQSATNTPATMAVGPLVIGRTVASSPTVTLSPNASQVSSYSLALPLAIPASTRVVTLDASGNLAAGSLIDSGIYSPTITAVIGSVGTIATFFYTRIFNIVTVSGSFQFVTTGPGAFEASISLPIAPTANFSSQFDVAGPSSANYVYIDSQMVATVGTKLAYIQASAVSSSSGYFSVSFTYSCA